METLVHVPTKAGFIRFQYLQEFAVPLQNVESFETISEVPRSQIDSVNYSKNFRPF
jgi:hypothetical protein